MSFDERGKRWLPLGFFLTGFLFDIFTVGRIDHWPEILKQTSYVFISGALVALDFVEERGVLLASLEHVRRWRIWKFREWLVHFMFGGLLNIYMLFYFKSATALSAFVLAGLFCLLILANEFHLFGKPSTRIRMFFFSLCLTSYFICMMPMVFGFIGVTPFVVAIAGAFLVTDLMRRRLFRVLGEVSRVAIRKEIAAPALAVQGAFVLFYFARVIPPVPLSVSRIGIYHGVTKANGGYLLTYTRPRWKFWQSGDQTFEARPGDRIYCFASVFSPTRFKDQLQIRWLYRDPRLGWQSSDAIPLQIVGGRDGGYRGFTFKEHYQPGAWRVQIETTDGREVGRIGFDVVPEDPTRAVTQRTEAL